MSIYIHNLSKKSNSATIADLKRINYIIKRIKDHPSKVVFKRVGDVEDLVVLGVGGAAFSQTDRSVGGNVIMLGNSTNNHVNAMYSPC